MAAYENRLVLFIDFLAFKEHVERTVTDATHLDRVVEAVTALRDVGMEDDVFPSQQLTHFSDSVVLSYRIDETSAVFWLLGQIALAVMNLASRGFLVRGAVTVGSLLHTNDVLVGPAMVRACELESKVATFPRVIIDPTVIAAGATHRSDQHSAKEEEDYIRRGLSTDADGQTSIDYVTWDAVVAQAGIEPDAYPNYIESLGVLISRGLGHDSPGVLRKYLWLHERYSAELQRFRQFTHANAEAEETRAFVAGLPLFELEAQAARQKILDAKVAAAAQNEP